MLQKPLALTVAAVFLSVVLAACASERTYQGAAAGGGVGAAAGVLLDKKNRWRGAVIGGALGALLGGTVTEVATRASKEAAEKNKTVTYKSDDGYRKVEATPVEYNAQTKCHKVRERIYEGDKVVKDQTKEICESDKTERTY